MANNFAEERYDESIAKALSNFYGALFWVCQIKHKNNGLEKLFVVTWRLQYVTVRETFEVGFTSWDGTAVTVVDDSVNYRTQIG